MKAMIEGIAKDEVAATAIEYALLAAMIALAALTAIATLGTSLEDLFAFIQEQL